MSKVSSEHLKECLIMVYVLSQMQPFLVMRIQSLNYCDNITQVSADVLCSLKDKSDIITLDIFTSLLPLLTSLLETKMDRYVSSSSSGLILALFQGIVNLPKTLVKLT